MIQKFQSQTARLLSGLAVLSLGAACTGELEQQQNTTSSGGPGQSSSTPTSGTSATSTTQGGTTTSATGGTSQGDMGSSTTDVEMGSSTGPDMAQPPALAPGPWTQYLDPDYNPNFNDQNKLFDVTQPPAGNLHVTVGRLRRQNRLEAVRNAGRWMPSRRGSTVFAQNPFEVVRPHIGFSTYSERESVGTDALAQYLNVLPDAGYSWVYPSGRRFFRIPTYGRDHPRAGEPQELPNEGSRRYSSIIAAVKADPAYNCMKTGDGTKPSVSCVQGFAQMYLHKQVYLKVPTQGDVDDLVAFLGRELDKIPQGSWDEKVLEAMASFTTSRASTGVLPSGLASNAAFKCIEPQESLAAPSNQCLSDFITLYLREAVLFRPPLAEEVEDLLQVATNSLAQLGAKPYGREERKNLVQTLTSAAWMGAPALFRSEVGQVDKRDAKGLLPLTSWEATNALGHAVGRRAPGAPAAFISQGGAGENRQWSIPGGNEKVAQGYFHELEQIAVSGSIEDRAALATWIRNAASGVDEDRRDLPVENQNYAKRIRRDKYWVAEGIQRFFREWLEVDQFATKFKEAPSATSKYHDNNRHIAGSYSHLQATGEYSNEPMYLEQLDDMIARIVQSDQDVFENLFTSRTFYTPGGTLSDSNVSRGQKPQYVYNIEGEHGSDRDKRRVTLPANERGGVLTHPVWLAAHSDNFENGTAIIYRGKWVRERLLCQHVPPVTDDVEAALVAGEGKSARQRVEESTEVPKTNCQGCHSLMNSLGKPFEIYNHAGFLRSFDTVDGTKISPDGSSTLERMINIDASDSLADGTVVRDGIEFSQKIATSTFARRCFIRQTFRYFMGRSETQSDAYTLSQMEMSYEMNNGSFIEMLVTLMTSDAFLKRLPLSVLDPTNQGGN